MIFVATTTTTNAASVLRHMEYCRQCLWPMLDVHLISITEQWAQYSVAGPNSRRVLQKIIANDFNISNESFPYMACGECTLHNSIPVRLFRISFSGELAYEIAAPTRYGDALIRMLMEAGKEYDIVPYGTEALGTMRIEKGHPAGNELTGQTTARDLGLARMVSKKKDCIGNILSERPELNSTSGLALVGFIPIDQSKELSAGAHFVSVNREFTTENDEGWMTSVTYSPSLRHSIGIGFIKQGNDRFGEIVVAVDFLRNRYIKVKIVSPHFLDPEGVRLRV